MLRPYIRVDFKNHTRDVDTGEIIQWGTPLSRKNLGHMDDAIYDLTETAINNSVDLNQLRAEMNTLKDATINNMVNNVFLETFDSLKDIRLVRGIYDPVGKRIYA